MGLSTIRFAAAAAELHRRLVLKRETRKWTWKSGDGTEGTLTHIESPLLTRHSGAYTYDIPDGWGRGCPQKADEVMRHLDIQSRETLKEMGLWEHMPAKNPIITRQSCKGADWHIGFEDYQHSLGGVPDSQPIERPHKADDLNRKLDIQSRNAIKEMGMWEHMPAKNPVVTRQSNKGADWHIGFGGYVHTLGGVPDPKIV